MRFYSLYRIVLFLLLLFSSKAYCQESCREKVYTASLMFDNGKFEEVIDLVQKCTSEEVELDIRWQAWRLLAISYLQINKSNEAQHAAEMMLELNPTYKPNEFQDPAGLKLLMEKVQIIPKFSMGLAFSLGGNITVPHVIESYALADYVKSYHSENGLMIGLSMGYQINKPWAIQVEFQGSQKYFNVSYDYVTYSYDIKEQLTYLDLPIMARYTIQNNHKIQPYLLGGIYTGYLLHSEGSYSFKSEKYNESSSLDNIATQERKNRINAGVLCGLGLAYLWKDGKLYLQSSYYKGLTEISKSPAGIQDNQLVYDFLYVDDKLKLNQFNIVVGYAINLNYKVLKENE